MKKENIKSFKLVGIKLNNKTTNLNGQSNKDCGALWKKFEEEKIFERISDKLENNCYAVYYDYGGNEQDNFAYFIGCKVPMTTKTPEGLCELIVPKGSYQKQTAKGQLPQCIAEAWQNIWKSSIERNFNYDFEVYDERSHNWENGEVDIYLS